MMDQNQSAQGQPISLKHDQYTVGWICALSIEMAASRAMLDREHEDLFKTADDPNEYLLGNIGTHNIVIACLPTGHYGTNNAAIVASNMLRSFRAIRVRLMVGIGGGAPSDAVDIRLGDVVVGTRIIQYDMGKIVSKEQLQRTAIPKSPPQHLLNALSKLRALHESTQSKISLILHDMLRSHHSMAEYSYPSLYEDWLFYPTYDHDHAGDCHLCDPSSLLLRPSRQIDFPRIHYGGIASGNQVVKYARTRDILAKELDVICFEMEAAGLMDHFPCIPIRGICDYADSHKNKQWQKYAAATAAAYAKELLLTMAPNVRAEIDTVMVTSNKQESTSRDDQISIRARRKQLLDLLRFEQLDSRHMSIKAADKKTCEWLLDHDTYKDWLEPTKLPQHHGFLWIRGKPGAGKSTLMKFAFGQAKKSTSVDTACASFFFHARGEELERSTIGMYRSLLLQLLEKFPDLQSTLDFIPSTATECPGIEILKDTFQSAILSLKYRKFTCYIDALDECDEGQILDMVQHFEDLGAEAAADQINLRICFASRHYPHIDIERGLKLIVENQQGHAEDLKKYVYGHLLNVGSKSYTENIKDTILQKAEGVFIWAVLVIEILNKEIRNGRTFAIERRLQQLPSRLSELFRDILLRDGTDTNDMLICILWILYAKRPLKAREFYFAVLSGLPDDSLVPCNEDQFTTDVMERYVVSSSKGLAEITKTEDGTVQLIHESVREFFLKDRGLREIWPTAGEDFEAFGHDIMQKCCLSQIVLDMSKEMPGDSRIPKAQGYQMMKLRQTLSKAYPFLPYAIKHVFHHANAAASRISQADFLHLFPLKKWVSINNILEKLEADRYTVHVSLPYILAHRDFDKLLQAYNEEGYDPFSVSRGERYGIPLFAALAKKNRLAAEVLVGQMGGDLSRRRSILEYLDCTSPFDSTNVQSPLLWAVEKGHTRIVAYLMSTNRFDLDERYSDQRTLLHIAVNKGHDKIAQLLIHDGNADIDAQDINHDMPLHVAADRGHETIVQMLLQEKANIEARNAGGWTPLHVAANRDHKTIIRMLICGKADVNVESFRLRSRPLHIAAKKGHETTIQVLLDEKAHIEARDSSHQTPLHVAADEGHETVVRLLIYQNANINAEDNEFRTPLGVAAERKNQGVVLILQAVGATAHYGPGRESFDRAIRNRDPWVLDRYFYR